MRNFILLWLITIFQQEQNYIRIREHAKEIGLSDIKMRKSYFYIHFFDVFIILSFQSITFLIDNFSCAFMNAVIYV